MSDEPTKARRVVLRYQDSWDELQAQLDADRSAGLAPSAVRDAVTAWFDRGSMVETGTLVRRASSSYRGGDTLEDRPTEVPADGLIAAWGRHHGSLVFVVADDPSLGRNIPDGTVRGAAAAAKATRLRAHALEQARPLVQVLASQRLEPGTFVGAEFVRFGFLVDLDEGQATLERILKLTIVTAALDEQATLEASASHLVVLAGPDAALYGHHGADALARGLADVAVADLGAALELVGQVLDHLPPSCFEAAPRCVTPADGAPAAASADGELLDEGWRLELAAAWQPTLRTSLGCVGGHLVGALSFDGSLVWSASVCNKAARLVRFCDAFRIPLVIEHRAGTATGVSPTGVEPGEGVGAGAGTEVVRCAQRADLDAGHRLRQALAAATTTVVEVAYATPSWSKRLGVRASWALGVGVADESAGGFDERLANGAPAVRDTVAAALQALPPWRRRMDQDERIQRRQPRVMQSEN